MKTTITFYLCMMVLSVLAFKNLNAQGDCDATTNVALNAEVLSPWNWDLDEYGWNHKFVVDGITTSEENAKGFTTDFKDSLRVDHTEWVRLDLGKKKKIGLIKLYPRSDDFGHGFPKSFTIKVSEDTLNWITVVDTTDYPFPDGTKASEDFLFTDQDARYVLLTATSLDPIPESSPAYRLQFAEIEIFANCVTSIEETSLNIDNVLLYPNPAVSVLTIETSTNNLVGYTILDLSGRSIMKGLFKENSQRHNLNIQQLNSGIYFIQLDQENENLVSKKFIIR